MRNFIALPCLSALAIALIVAAAPAGAEGCSAKPEGGPEQVLVNLLDLEGQGERSAAYDLTSARFRGDKSEAELTELITGTGLGMFTEWRLRKSFRCLDEAWIADIIGTVTLETGTEVPIGGTVISENGNWRIDGIWKEADDVASLIKAAGKPSKADMAALAKTTLAAFVAGSADHNMANFLAASSKLLQADKSRAMLGSSSFSAFNNPRLKEPAEAVLREFSAEPKWLDGQVTISVKGEYKSQPFPLLFNFDYAFEDKRWLLVNFTISAGSSEELLKSIPAITKSGFEELARNTMTEFVRSVSGGSMASFHASVSERLRSAYTVAGFDKAFGSMFGKVQPDMLDGLPVIITEFPDKPSIAGNAAIVPIKGYFESISARHTFEITFVYEGESWRVTEIKVNFGKSVVSHNLTHCLKILGFAVSGCKS